jgi:hypothetical protein
VTQQFGKLPSHPSSHSEPRNHVDPINCKVTRDGRSTLQFSRNYTTSHPQKGRRRNTMRLAQHLPSNNNSNPTAMRFSSTTCISKLPTRSRIYNLISSSPKRLHLAPVQVTTSRLVVVDGHQNVLPERIASSVLPPYLAQDQNVF